MEIICFHRPDEENGYLSNWHHSEFTVDGVKYSSMEQYMMHKKAEFFNDDCIAECIMDTDDPGEIKDLGRKVSNFDTHQWNGVRQIIVYEGLIEKFSQNAELKEKLKATGDAILVECVVKDLIWANGTSFYEDDRFDVSKWKGENLLGYTLMMVRQKL